VDASHAPVAATALGWSPLLYRIAAEVGPIEAFASLCGAPIAAEFVVRLHAGLGGLDPQHQSAAVSGLVRLMPLQAGAAGALWPALCGGWHRDAEQLAIDLHDVLRAITEHASAPPPADFEHLRRRVAELDAPQRIALLPDLLRAHAACGLLEAHAQVLHELATGMPEEWRALALSMLLCEAPELTTPADIDAAIAQLPGGQAAAAVVDRLAAVMAEKQLEKQLAKQLDALIALLVADRELRPCLAVLLDSPSGEGACRALIGPALDDDALREALAPRGVTRAWLAAAERVRLPDALPGLLERLLGAGGAAPQTLDEIVTVLLGQRARVPIEQWDTVAILAETFEANSTVQDSDAARKFTARLLEVLAGLEPLPEHLASRRDRLSGTSTWCVGAAGKWA